MINTGDSTISVLRGRGGGTFSPAVAHPLIENPVAVISQDLNKDTIPDLVLVSGPLNVASVSIGRGNGAFSTPSTFSVGNAPSSIVSGYFDKDENLDPVA